MKIYEGEDEENASDGTESGSSRKKKSSFLLKSALTSLWLPSIVGDRRNMLLVSTISTLVSKIAILALALVLAFFGLQTKVFEHPFVLWCEEEWEETAQGN